MAECAHFVEGPVCCSKEMLQKMQRFLKKRNKQPPTSPKDIIQELMKLLNVQSELEVLNHPTFKAEVSGTEQEKYRRFLPRGPKFSTALINSINIDQTLNQLGIKYHPRHKKRACFYPVKYQMIDFKEQRTELASISLPDLYKRGYNCMGVVLNTDVSSGPGIHWFCIFWDATRTPWRLEYFNSSGNRPVLQVHDWVISTIADCRKQGQKCDLKISTPYQIQQDDHSCGVYCLAYIYCRLRGKSWKWFLTTKGNDDEMIRFREKLFREQ
jgi:hypothetical protein